MARRPTDLAKASGYPPAQAIAGVLLVLVLAAPRGKDAPASPPAQDIVVPDLTGLEIDIARAASGRRGSRSGW